MEHKKFIVSLVFFLPCFFSVSTTAQVTASFTIPDTVCVNTPVTITNTSIGASTSFWNFCVADVNAAPQAASLGNIGNSFAIPVYIDYVSENGNYYGFLVNNSPGGLIRLDFGNSLLNTPVATNLGNFGGIISNSAQGIQVVKNNGRWYAIILTGDPGTVPATPSRILKVDFGTNLTNATPAATNWGNIGNMNYPHDLYMFQDASNNWYGLTVSFRSSTITKFSFGADFNSAPTGVNLGNLGNLNGPTGICPINDNGTWRVFVSNLTGSTISRIDFGNSLVNAPTGSVNLGNLFSNPRDMYLFNYCGQSVGFVVSNTGSMARLSFNSLSSTPTVTSLGNVGGASNFHSISKVFRVGNDLFAFMPNAASNTLIRFQLAGCTNSNIPNSASATPAAISYTSPGTYNINLTVDDGLPTQTSACKQIVVMAADQLSISKDTSVCFGDSAQFNISNAKSYAWTPASGLSGVSIANPKSSPSASTNYSVAIVDKNGCNQQLAVKLNIIALPVITVNKSGDIDCSNGSVQLTASGAAQYKWSPVTGLSDATIANPVSQATQSTTYKVTGTSSAGCVASASIQVVVLNSAGGNNPYLMPTAFSPNKDGLNDCFGVSKWGNVKQLEFYIYNRWGEVIFFTKDPSKCWDGNLKGIQQPSGTYVYQLRAEVDCANIERHGTFVLIR